MVFCPVTGFEGDPYAGPMPNAIEGEIMHFEVVGEDVDLALTPMPMFKVERPCYVADLLKVPAAEMNTEPQLIFMHDETGLSSPPYPGTFAIRSPCVGAHASL